MSSTPGLPRDWIPTLVGLLEHEPLIARVVVTESRGSTPREPGAFMLVGRDTVAGSIGGGRLEWEAIAAARDLLAAPDTPARVNKVTLAADVGQCCGGVVSVWLDKFSHDDLPLLRSAADAGARGPAVFVSEVMSDAMHRRLVRYDSRPRTPTVVSALAATDPTTTAPMPPQMSQIRARLQQSTVSSDDITAATDELLRSPRQHAQPVLVTTAGALTSNGTPAKIASPGAAVSNGAPANTTSPGTATPGDAVAPSLAFIERLDDSLPAVWLYGAGHVGQALARILTELPLRPTWIDSRAELFPQPVPDTVRVLQDPDSVATVSDAPVGAYFIVMSHSHPLDFELCHALLERNDFAWLGLIGSDSKAARFRSRLARTGLGADVIAKLVCPIGVEGITSKWPAAIAVAVAAQLMQKISAAAEHPGVPLPVAPLPMSPLATACAPEVCATCGTSAEAAGRADETDGTPADRSATTHAARSDTGLVAPTARGLRPDTDPTAAPDSRPDTVTS